ncbi:MAG: PH domain-containing protein [Thermoplasmata archaeon]|nr:PH domain-containing protein [Thermoplasmata archaeon]
MDGRAGTDHMYAGEQTLLVTRPTRLIAMRYWTAMVLALILAAVFVLHIPSRFVSSFPNPSVAGLELSTILGAFFVFLGLLAFLAAEFKRKSIRYIITDNKITREDGILNKNTEMIPYTQLERVDLHQSFGQRILKIGTIVVDTGDDKLSIDMVRHPAKIQDLLSNRLGRRAWAGQTPPGQPQGPPPKS